MFQIKVDVVIYLVDAYDTEGFAESKKELDPLISDKSLANVPFLILGNKIDLPYAASEHELRFYLGLSNFTTDKGGGFKWLSQIEQRPQHLGRDHNTSDATTFSGT